MKIISNSFPSVFETAFGNTENSARDLLNGIRIKHDNNWFMVGNLAKKGGINPQRVINAAPTEMSYELLFKAAMVNLVGQIQSPYCITTGFPLSAYNAFKQPAEAFLNRKHFLIEYDTRTFNTAGELQRTTFDLDTFEVIPEIVGAIIGLKKILHYKAPSNFIIISLGFGTIEGGMISEDGLINRTCFSSHGLHYAVGNLQKELSKKFYLEMKNVHQLDDSFMKGSIVVNRKRTDIKDIRKNILQQYYREVISPLIRTYLTDADFESCEKIYLVGGGSLYPELFDAFSEEFAEALPVEIAPEPEKLASIGYLYNSLRISGQFPARCAGIDIGNSSTVISIFEPA